MFTSMEGGGGEFSPLELSSYVSLQFSHFSGIGVTQEEGESIPYCAGFYYSRISPTLQRVHFVIAKDVNLEELTKVSYLDFMTP